MKILVCKPNKKPFKKGIRNNIKSMQKVVDGNIKLIGSGFGKVAVAFNEEGKLLNLEKNKLGIAGTFFFVGIDCNNFRSLTHKEILELRSRL